MMFNDVLLFLVMSFNDCKLALLVMILMIFNYFSLCLMLFSSDLKRFCFVCIIISVF